MVGESIQLPIVKFRCSCHYCKGDPEIDEATGQTKIRNRQCTNWITPDKAFVGGINGSIYCTGCRACIRTTRTAKAGEVSDFLSKPVVKQEVKQEVKEEKKEGYDAEVRTPPGAENETLAEIVLPPEEVNEIPEATQTAMRATVREDDYMRDIGRLRQRIVDDGLSDVLSVHPAVQPIRTGEVII